ncbi:MAG TPA: LacI family DNA-binding transcriptional regulator [Propionibacteriaceae bacterium]|nr:LacI family DNA-binding transcriptional regulator [Propionibacteriaceae bacterium]
MAARKTTVSMKDVAALAGVSLGTVSNVLNSPDIVAEPTRRRVELAIAKLGWIPNEPARQLRAGRSRSIGMIVMDISNPFYTDLVIGAENCVRERGYSVQVGNSSQEAERESAQLLVLMQQRVRGVLLAPIWGIDERVRQLKIRGIPVVLLDRAGNQSDFCSVSTDDVEGGRLAVQHLLDEGHTSIAVVGGPGDLQQVHDRRLGAELASSRHDGSVRLLTLSTTLLDVDSGVRAAEELVLMPSNERPTAVFAANDLLAIGLLQGFVTAGLRVPDEMAIVGYDDIAFAAAAAVPLSSVRQPRLAIGYRAAELLFDEIEMIDRDGSHDHQQIRFTPELVVRRSSAKTGDLSQVVGA